MCEVHGVFVREGRERKERRELKRKIWDPCLYKFIALKWLF